VPTPGRLIYLLRVILVGLEGAVRVQRVVVRRYLGRPPRGFTPPTPPSWPTASRRPCSPKSPSWLTAARWSRRPPQSWRPRTRQGWRCRPSPVGSAILFPSERTVVGLFVLLSRVDPEALRARRALQAASLEESDQRSMALQPSG